MKRDFAFKKIALMCIISFFVLGVFHSTATGLTLDEVQKAIKEKNAKWVAEDNSISMLPTEKREKRLGAFFDLNTGDGEWDRTQIFNLPTRFDWRDEGKVTPVKDQGDCGSCWAFSTVGALESLILIEYGGVKDLSEQFLVSCNWLNKGCDGGSISTTNRFLKKTGVPRELCFPYKGKDLPCSRKCLNWRNSIVKISKSSLVRLNVDAIKAAVYENPVTASFFVYADFFFYIGGVYEYTIGTYQGNHSVLIVGWDDNPPEGIPCFIVKNSWGKSWGENGYFRIGYSQIMNRVLFGQNTYDYDIE